MIEFKKYLRRFASRLPKTWQQEMKRIYFRMQISAGKFVTTEKEFLLLQEWIKPGDWVMDIGANIGHYALKMSDLVSNEGRVVAFEPVPDTFELLVANTSRSKYRNLTLLNLAGSDTAAQKGMGIPKFKDGVERYYMAHFDQKEFEFKVLCIKIDALYLPHKTSLIKIDVEGHELSVLKGMENLLLRDHPVLIVEDNVPEVVNYLCALGYTSKKYDGSHNRVFNYLN